MRRAGGSGSRVPPPSPVPLAPARRRGETAYRPLQQQARGPLELIDHDGLERLRHGHAFLLLRPAHVLRDQADHVAAEREERQHGERHLERRLHRAVPGPPRRRVRSAPQRHGVWQTPVRSGVRGGRRRPSRESQSSRIICGQTNVLWGGARRGRSREGCGNVNHPPTGYSVFILFRS